MKTSFAKYSVLLILSGILSCDTTDKDRDASQYEDAVEKSEESNERRFYDKEREREAEFLVDAAASNLTEIKLAEYALERASLKEVKDLAAALKRDHEKMMEDIRKLGMKKNVTLPQEVGEDGNKMHQRLVDKNEIIFDETYLDMMQNSHEESKKMLENAERDFKEEQELLKFVQDGLFVVKMHVEEIKELQELVKEKKAEINKATKKSI